MNGNNDHLHGGVRLKVSGEKYMVFCRQGPEEVYNSIPKDVRERCF